MIISDDTRAVVDYLNQYCENNLRKRNDVESIFEIAANSNDDVLITHLSFHSSVVWKVFGVMKKESPGSDSFRQLESEFATSLNEMRTALLAISQAGDDELSKRFHDIYLGMGGGVMRNLTDLAHDFTRFKEMQNELRRS